MLRGLTGVNMQLASPFLMSALVIQWLKRVPTFFAVLGLAACATSQGRSTPWYQGSFTGAFPTSEATEIFSLLCPATGKCDLQFNAQVDQGATKAESIPTKPPVPMATLVPNNNLDFTRRALLNNPAHAQDPRYRLLLSKLRPILATESGFANCVDISQDAPGYAVLCALVSDADAKGQLLLLLSTMNPSCGKQLFCAYYFIPLQRVERGR